ncbi:DUF4118 domain-containing protein [Clostridium sporogenes]
MNKKDMFNLNKYINIIRANEYKINFKNVFLSIFKMIIIMTTSTLLSLVFRHIGFHESNIIVVFILGVLFVAKYTEGYFYGICSSIIGVLTFNFFFTEPYYSLSAYRSDYPVTFAIMLIAAVITSTLTSRIKKEARISSIREKRMELLYYINKGLLKSRNKNQVIEFCGKNLFEMFNRPVIISVANSRHQLEESNNYIFNNNDEANIFQSTIEKQAILESFKIGKAVGVGTNISIHNNAYYQPIIGQSSILGIIGLSCFDGNLLSENDKILLKSVSTQIALAIEREHLFEKQKKANLETEKEKLRGNLLRSISHDLRTPLTGILGSVTTIIDNNDVLDNDTKNELLENIFKDASWLVHSVENILSMTRIDEGKLEIKKNLELVEEIISGAISKVKRFGENHTLKVGVPDKLILVNVDGLLIQQVIVNLIDNAIKYTPANSVIEINVKEKNDRVIFQVLDNGNGILEEDLNNIFDRFYISTKSGYLEKRGTGLGLAICKSIIEAHGGEIFAFNNLSGGATFEFSLPLKE